MQLYFGINALFEGGFLSPARLENPRTLPTMDQAEGDN